MHGPLPLIGLGSNAGRKSFWISSGTSANKVFDVETEDQRDPIQNGDRWVALPTFQTAQVGLMDGSLMRELLLRQASLTPGVLQIQANADPYIHEAMDETAAVAPIDYKS